MSVRSVLFLLVLLTCCRDISVLAAIGDTCITFADCADVNDAVCVNQVCTCISSYVPDSGLTHCLPKVGLGESCAESIQCEDLVQAECVLNTCQCRSGFNYNGERCVGNSGLGEVCLLDSECVVPNDPKQETVWCFNRQCACRLGYKRDGNRCVIGGDCGQDSDCRDLANSYCDTPPEDRQQCECATGFVPVADNTKCLPIASDIGSGCEYDEQCSYKLGNAVCTNYRCECAAGSSLNVDNTCGPTE